MEIEEMIAALDNSNMETEAKAELVEILFDREVDNTRSIRERIDSLLEELEDNCYELGKKKKGLLKRLRRR